MAKADTILSFENLSFEWGVNKPILDTVNFTVRRGSKVTIMGQNGAGKSTVFGLITRENKPDSGRIIIQHGLTIAMSRQVIPREQMDLTVREFFLSCFEKPV